MRITKEAQEYINDFAKKAAKIFKDFNLCYGGALGVPEYIPDEKELTIRITSLVADFDKTKYWSNGIGRIEVTTSDFSPGFRLYIDLKETRHIPQPLEAKP